MKSVEFPGRWPANVKTQASTDQPAFNPRRRRPSWPDGVKVVARELPAFGAELAGELDGACCGHADGVHVLGSNQCTAAGCGCLEFIAPASSSEVA